MSRLLLIEAAFATKQLPHDALPEMIAGVCPMHGGEYSSFKPPFKAVLRGDGRVVMWSQYGCERDDLMMAMGLFVRQDGFECLHPEIVSHYQQQLHNPEVFAWALAEHDIERGVRLQGRDLDNYREHLRRTHAQRGAA